MFKHLRSKLTVLYAGLFCIALMFIGATAYLLIANNTQRHARAELEDSAGVFDRLTALRLAHLEDGAQIAAQSPALLQAATERNSAAALTVLEAWSHRIGADIALLVTPEGLIIGGANVATSVSPGLQMALERDDAPIGAMTWGDELIHCASARLPNGAGWVLLGARIGDPQRDALEDVSSIPLETALIVRERGDNRTRTTADAELNALIDGVLAGEPSAPQTVRTAEGPAVVLAHPLLALDGTRSVLLLRYSLSHALSPYGALFGTLFAIGLAALAMLVSATWFLARGITQPLSTLEEAANHLQQGVYDTVVVSSTDELGRLAGSFNAMTAAIRERERRITHLAYHDSETGLPNRALLQQRLTVSKQTERLYLAAIGVERFAHMRGAIGYALSALLMRKLGGRLAQLLPNAPIVRLSSDVLGVAFLAHDENDARKRGDALVANLEESLSLDDQVVDVSVSIGIAQPRAKGETTAAMIERASIALDQARAAAHKVAVFDKSAYGDPALNLSLMGEMRRDLGAGPITLVHQPKYNFRTGRIDSAESLVRWRHPTRGLISPDLFVPMAEEMGQIGVLTEWVLREAIADQRKLSAAGFPLMLSVNISARLLSDAGFARSAIEEVRRAPPDICIEITETAVIDNPKAALENIDRFAAAGIRVAIDDYGSGLSSLSYLKQLPAQELKLDKVFVQNITNSQRDALLVRSTIDLAHGLGMEVVGEGVETPAAFALLAGMQCDLAQGYLISRPAPVEDLLPILGDERRMQYYQQTAATRVAPAAVGETRPKHA
jgi:EAL domain-containing protein (putative c-di-GMP-specific phosphodiesterase class I)/GGDEF domain-containing protein